VTNVTTQDTTTGTKGLQRVILSNTGNAWTGTTTVSANSRLELATSEVLPHGSGKGNVVVNGNLILSTTSGDSTETINGLGGNGAITRTGTVGTSTLIVGESDGGGTFSGPITNGSGTLALTKVGAGTLILTGQNTYTGLTTVSAGTLQLDFPDMLPDAGTIEVASTATLHLPHAETETVSSLRIDGVPQATGTWGRIGSIAALGATHESAIITGDGLLEVTNLFNDAYWDGTGTSWQSAAAWAISPTDDALNPSAPPGLNNTTRFGLDGLAAPQFITLDGDQATPGMTFTSPVSFTFEGGTADHLLEIGTAGISMAPGSTGVIFGSFTAGQEVDLRLAGSQTWSNESASGDLAASNTVDLQTNTLTITGAGDSFVDGLVTGTGALTKSGAGALGLFGTNDYAGLTTIQGGSIFLGTSTALGGTAAGTTIGGGATLDLNGQSVGAEPVTLGATTAGNLINTNTITPASLAGDVNLNFNSNIGGTGDLTLDGVINQTGGARNLAKTGTGKLTLTNANLYTGTTTIGANTGTLAITHGAALGTGPVNISKNNLTTGTLELSNDITVANTFTISSATGLSGGGLAHIRNISGNNILTGSLTLSATGGNGINLESNDGLLTISGNIGSTVADSSRTLTLGGSGNGLVTGNILDNAAHKVALVKTGAGTWTLSGTANTYSNTTNVNAGTLALTQNGGLADTAGVNIGTGATLDLAFTGSDTVASLTIGGVLQGPGTFDASHPSGQITGTGSLTVPGTDPFTPWINGFTFAPGADKTKTGDPDGDGLSNVQEFAFNSDPSSGSATGGIVGKVDAGHLTLTVPVRSGAVFSGSGPLVATIDDVRYEIDAGTDLGTFTTAIEETAVLSAGLPVLTTGWTYRTFRLVAPVTAAPKAFLRADATDAP
jgi:autotransporter-associated beta strand protein